jgi:hypothetical protein
VRSFHAPLVSSKEVVMSSQIIKVSPPPVVAWPRGAFWAAMAAVWFGRAFAPRPTASVRPVPKGAA